MSVTYVNCLISKGGGVEGWKGGFSKKGQEEMSMTYVDNLISKGGRVEGWKGGLSKKGPSGDVDDVR